MDAAQVKTLQTNLNRKGYGVGVIDGGFGPKTLCALIGYALARDPLPFKPHAEALAPIMIRCDIVGPYRTAHFLANCSVETMGFSKLRESTAYTSAARLDALFRNVRGIQDADALIRKGAVAIGNRIYAGVHGNGDEASGDGFTFRGGGYLHHTGRRNYQLMSLHAGIDLVAHPERIAEPEIAARAAAGYWCDNGLHMMADRNDAGAVRVAVNGPAKLDLVSTAKIAKRITEIWL